MNACKRCSECEGEKHHWMDDCNDEGDPVWACKHCDVEIPMDDETTFIETSQGRHTFYFVCEGCGENGMLDVPEVHMLRQIACPVDCGASYIPWTDPISNTPALMCVVAPVVVK